MTHLIVLVADTLRDPGGLPGFDPAKGLPFLTPLLARGQVYRKFVASAPWTIPSHVSLLTGRNPWSVVYAGREGLSIPVGPSLADAWRTATGGASWAWSANGLIGPGFRTTPGYDLYNAGSARLRLGRRIAKTLAPIRGPVIAANGLAPPVRLFGDLEAPRRGPDSRVRRGAYRALGSALYTCSSAMLSGRALLDGLARSLRRRPPKVPLHLLFNLMETHEPYALGPPSTEGPWPAWLSLPLHSLGSFQRPLQDLPGVPDLLREAYGASLRRLDARLRELFDALQREGILRDALVVLVSDHGQSLGEKGRFGHGNSLADELLRVPCAAWRFLDGRTRGPAEETSAPFDHRHLHDALRSFIETPGTTSLTPLLERSLQLRGPAVSFQEGSPSAVGLGRRAGRGDLPIERALRVMERDREALVPLELAEGRLRPAVSRTDERPVPAVARVLADLARDRERENADTSSVDRRLSAWGYV